MLCKTRGIVLNFIKYRETSIIAKIYTEDYGLKSFIINGVRSKSSKMKVGLFQPLTLLDLVIYYKENSTLNRISEIKCSYPYKSIPFEIRKSAITLFLSEVLTKTLKEENSNLELFEFLNNSLISLDTVEVDYQNFHLQFLFQYSAFLGFAPSTIKDLIGKEHDLIDSQEKIFLEKLIGGDYRENIECSNSIRRNCLQFILNFYKYHIENFGEVNSEKILKEVLK